MDSDSFVASLQEFLDRGSFRLVLVLDEVSAELERVVAYLDALTLQALTIDLITLNVYEVNNARIALPQRVSPDLDAAIPVLSSGGARSSGSKGTLSDGTGAFRASIAETTGEIRAMFDDLIQWAERVAKLPGVRLFTYKGVAERYTLLPRIMPDKAGLVDHLERQAENPTSRCGAPCFERHAPDSIDAVEATIAPLKLAQGKYHTRDNARVSRSRDGGLSGSRPAIGQAVTHGRSAGCLPSRAAPRRPASDPSG